MSDKVVVTLPLPESVMVLLRDQFELQCWTSSDPMPEPLLVEWIADAVGLLCALNTPVTRDVIRSGRCLKVISTVSVGVDHIDLDAALAAGIPVGHTPGVLTDSTADLTLALMLAVTRRIPEADRFVRRGDWSEGWSTGFFLGSDLHRARVGLVGLGPIGQAVAKRLQAFGAKVVAWNRTPKEVVGVENVGLEELFATADIVSLHTASTPQTRHILSASRLALMKPGAVVINTARGNLIDEEALAEALSSGRIRAGLDVYQHEPLPSDSPLLELDNLVMLPHLGSATAATREAMIRLALDNLLAGMAGQSLPAAK